mgnify:CR=1 FL=1
MTKVETSQAPAAIGPYSQAVCMGRVVFTSGQIPVVPETGVVPEGIEAQTIQSLENLKTILEGTGSDFDHVVKTTIFLADIADFGKVNEIYAKYFANEVPARSCVEVANLPKAGLVEIEAIAVEK